MQDLWDRIDAGLRRILGADAERHLTAPGATAEELDALEAEIGFPLPDDFRQSWAIRNGGVRCMPCGVELTNVKELLCVPDVGGHLRNWREGYSDWDLETDLPFRKPVGPIAHAHWTQGWVPVAGDGNDSHLCIDLDPPAGGTPGQVFDWDSDDGATGVFFPSWRAYLEQFARDLESDALVPDPDESYFGLVYTPEVAAFRNANPGRFEPDPI